MNNTTKSEFINDGWRLTGLIPEDTSLPKHLIRLPGGDWTLWNFAVLRGAGFPVKLLLALANDECSQASERAIELQEASRRARADVVSEATKLLDDLKSTGQWDERYKAAFIAKRNQLLM